jgi:hypothetical protein
MYDRDVRLVAITKGNVHSAPSEISSFLWPMAASYINDSQDAKLSETNSLVCCSSAALRYLATEGNVGHDGNKRHEGNNRRAIRGENGTFFRASDNARLGNIPENRGAYFRDRNVGRGSAHFWLASRIVDFD